MEIQLNHHKEELIKVQMDLGEAVLATIDFLEACRIFHEQKKGYKGSSENLARLGRDILKQLDKKMVNDDKVQEALRWVRMFHVMHRSDSEDHDLMVWLSQKAKESTEEILKALERKRSDDYS